MIKIGLLLIQLSTRLEGIKWAVATRKDEQATFEAYAKLLGSQEFKELQKPPQLVETEQMMSAQVSVWRNLFQELIQELLVQLPSLSEDRRQKEWWPRELKELVNSSTPDVTAVQLMQDVFKLIQEHGAVFGEGG